MQALTVIPGRPESAALLELPEPEPAEGEVLVEGRLVGVCGTDVEIVHGGHGAPPPGEERLVLGHESLGRVWRPRRAAAWSRARTSSASSGGRTRCPARAALSGSGTSAATAAT